VFGDVCTAIYNLNEKKVPAINYVYGLGGRDIDEAQIKNIFNELVDIAKTGQVKTVLNYSGVRI